MFSQLGSVRPTKVDVSNTWHKKFQQSLLSEQEETTLGDDQLHTEKNAAFDLSNNYKKLFYHLSIFLYIVDALSKSGELVLDHTSLHIVIATTHQFDKVLFFLWSKKIILKFVFFFFFSRLQKSLLDTLIQENVNPIEQSERLSCIVGSIGKKKQNWFFLKK